METKHWGLLTSSQTLVNQLLSFLSEKKGHNSVLLLKFKTGPPTAPDPQLPSRHFLNSIHSETTWQRTPPNTNGCHFLMSSVMA